MNNSSIEFKWWHTDYKGTFSSHQKGCLKLIKKLLSLGGKQVCIPCIEEDLNDIYNRGFYQKGNKSILNKGRPSQCHRNSCILYENNKNLSIVTGYALSDDGYWRQHSWCFDNEKQVIIETTTKRIAYFGFTMTEEEAEQFCFDNW